MSQKHLRGLHIIASIVTIVTMVVPFSFAGVQFVQATGVSVSGRLVSPTGTALTDVQAWIQIDPANGGPGFGEPAQENGSFTVNGVTSGSWNLNISYNGSDDYVGPATQTFNVSSTSVNLGDIRLALPQISGVALEPTGNTPLADTNINLQSADYTINRGARTDEQGAFQFGGLRKGSYTIMVEPSADSGFTQGRTTVNLAQDNSVVTGVQVRATVPNVVGVVVKPDNSALEIDMDHGEGVNLDLHNEDRTVQMHTNAAEDGSFSFGGVSAGTYVLEVSPWGLSYTSAVPVNVTVAGSGVTNVGNVRLTSPKVQGTVTDPDGEPVRDAWIQIHTQDWSVQTGGNTNELGQYQIGGIANGTYLIEVQRPWNRSDLIPPDAASITVTDVLQTKNIQFVAATKFLTGTVRRSAGASTVWTFSGNVVTNAQVNAFKEGGNGWANTNVDSNGNYSLSLSPGVWNIMVQAPWGPNGQETVDWVYMGQPKQVKFANNSTVERKTLPLEVRTADANIKGQLLTADGRPITNASVDLRTDSGSGMNGQVQANGRFNIPVVAGSYRLMVWTNDQSITFPEISLSVKSGETKDLGAIRATTKNARIIVKAVKDSDETGISGLRVNVFKQDSKGGGWGQSLTDDNGISELAVTPGKWGVHIEAGPGARYVSAGGPPIDVEVPEEDSVISYEDNDQLLIEMTYADATISGHIVDENGDVITGLCSYAFARPDAGTVGEDKFKEYGGPVNCQSGAFEIYVPTDIAGTYTLGAHTPPNASYLPEGDQTVAVFSDSTTEADIVMVAPNARLSGHLVDQNGDTVSECRGNEGFGGWVDLSNHEKGQWFGTELQADCTYSVNLLAGPDYRLNVWTGPNSGFMERPPSDETFTVKVGDNTRNFEVMRADKTISGRVTDPDGKGVDAFVFAHTMNDKSGPPSPEDMQNELFSGTKTDPEGNYELGVVSGQWEVGGGLPPDNTELLPPKFQQVDMTNQDSATIDLQLQEALGQMRGRLLVGGGELQYGFVACWDDENGTFSGAPAENGEYALNYSAGTYKCQADSFEGETFFRSEEVQMTFTDQTSVEQDFELTASDFKIPPPVSATFSSTEAQVLTFENGTTVTIPAGALSSEEQDVTVTGTPTINLQKNKNSRPFGAGYDLVAKDANDQTISQFVQNVTIEFTYDEDQLAEFGIEDEGLLSANFFSSESNTWQAPTSVSIDTNLNKITIQTNHFTTFAVVGSGGAQAVAGGAKTIVVSPKANGGPNVTTWTGTGDMTASFMAFATSFRGGVNSVMGDVNGDGVDEIVAAPYSAGGPQIRIFNASGTALAGMFPYATGYRGGLSLALGNVDDDASLEIIVGPSTGGGPQVRVFDYADSGFTAHGSWFAYPTGLRTGIAVQTGDTDGDDVDEVVTTANTGAAPHVRTFDGYGVLKGQFFAFPVGFRGGVNATVADVNSDGSDDIIVSPKAAGGPQVRVVRPDGSVLGAYFAYDSAWRLGVKTGVGDVNGDGDIEVITAPQNGGPHIKVFNTSGTLIHQFMAYDAGFRGGVELVVGNVDADTSSEIITAPRIDGGPHVRAFDGDDGYSAESFMALASGFRGGVNLSLSR